MFMAWGHPRSNSAPGPAPVAHQLVWDTRPRNSSGTTSAWCFYGCIRLLWLILCIYIRYIRIYNYMLWYDMKLYDIICTTWYAWYKMISMNKYDASLQFFWTWWLWCAGAISHDDGNHNNDDLGDNHKGQNSKFSMKTVINIHKLSYSLGGRNSQHTY